ncbi:MAG: ABC transporter permease subunit [Endomicrobium sp.]|jgi:raffinose/stachyose/melibiose transport system permease protein|nr:ABC transporter permease subunit [Endomicrobium sp.]
MNKLFKHFFFIVSFVFIITIFLSPIVIVLWSSLRAPSDIPALQMADYYAAFLDSGFFKACIYSVFITIFSTGFIVFFSSMAAWMIIRVKNRINRFFYYCFVFSAFVPFAALMWTMPKTAELVHLNNPLGLIFLYLGFGAGLSIFIFSFSIKKIPVEIEEAALLDGCSLIQVFSNVVLPMLRPATIVVALINAIWIWNDYLMPSLIIGEGYETITMSIMKSGLTAYNAQLLSISIILSIIPILVFYVINRRQIIKSFAIGAPK